MTTPAYTGDRSTAAQRGHRAAAVLACLLPALGMCGETFELGGMYTYHYRDGRYADWGDYALHGARLAIDEINAGGMLGDDRIRLRPENTIDYHCWPENAALMAETLMQKDILVLTGADCSGPAVEIARVAERYGVPVISNGANASMLSSTEAFPWFVRVVPPSEAFEGYLIDLAAEFGITAIAYFHTTDAWGLGAKKVIHDYADRRGVSILQEYGYPRDTPFDTVLSHVRKVRDANIRHIVVTGPTPDTVTLFRALHALDMNRPGYTIYAAEMISADEEPQAVAGSIGYFAPMTHVLPSALLDHFRAALEERLGHAVDVGSKAFFYGALSYDHIYAVAHAIRAIREDGGTVDRQSTMRALRKVDFPGVTGRVAIAPGTNDRANMPLQIVNSHGYKDDGRTVDFVSIAAIDPGSGRLVIDRDKIVWPGRATRAPGE